MLNGNLVVTGISARGFNAISPVQISVDEDTLVLSFYLTQGYNYAIRGYRYGAGHAG